MNDHPFRPVPYLLLAVVFVLLQVLSPLHQAISSNLGNRTAAWLYDRYKEIKLPDFLAFFGGRRFVPIITAAASIGVGVIAGRLLPRR